MNMHCSIRWTKKRCRKFERVETSFWARALSRARISSPGIASLSLTSLKKTRHGIPARVIVKLLTAPPPRVAADTLLSEEILNKRKICVVLVDRANYGRINGDESHANVRSWNYKSSLPDDGAGTFRSTGQNVVRQDGSKSTVRST